LACPVNKRLHRGRVTLENCFDRAVFAIGNPTGNPKSPSLAPTAVTKEHTLNSALGNHSATNHLTSVALLPESSC
jgi:hypothetical protein